MKTGTTYLQQILMLNHQALLEAGILYPLSDEGWRLQYLAVVDVRRSTTGKDDESTRAGWAELHRQVVAHGGTSVVSMEFMSFCDAEQAGEFVRRLAGCEVHVVFTVRDAASAVSAVWQERARNRQVQPWRQFIEALTATPPDPTSEAWTLFTRSQGVPQMLDAWLAHVPAERVHIVTVPRGALPTTLWERFAGVIGVEASVAAQLPGPQNESLGHASAEFARVVNKQIRGPRSAALIYAATEQFGKQILPRHRPHETPIQGGQLVRDFGARWNAATREAIMASGAHVIGDLDDLPTVAKPTSETISEPTQDEVLQAAGVAVVELERLNGAATPTSSEALIGRWSARPFPTRAAALAAARLIKLLAGEAAEPHS